MEHEMRVVVDDRLDQLELKIDRLTDLIARVADDLDTVAAVRESVDAGFAEARQENQRGFADLRNAIRHFGVRIGEADRWRR